MLKKMTAILLITIMLTQFVSASSISDTTTKSTVENLAVEYVQLSKSYSFAKKGLYEITIRARAVNSDTSDIAEHIFNVRVY